MFSQTPRVPPLLEEEILDRALGDLLEIVLLPIAGFQADGYRITPHGPPHGSHLIPDAFLAADRLQRIICLRVTVGKRRIGNLIHSEPPVEPVA